MTAESPPYVGALLRLCFQHARDRVIDAIRAAGFTDLHETHLGVFSYPLPDGVRPSELARRLAMSRQATNHVITQMEVLGYLERRGGEGERRLVFMTARSRAVAEAIWASMRALQDEWRAELGEERFAVFIGALRQLAADPPATRAAQPASARSSRRARQAPARGR